MANVLFPNYNLDTNTASNSFSALWKLTRAMKKSGWKVLSYSDGVTKTAIANGADAWGSNIDPASDVYPNLTFDAHVPWIVMSGPMTLKVPITAAGSGTFLRGEKITQAGSGVEGECFGYVFDTVSNTGWMVVGDRTGCGITASTNAYTNAWTSSGVITGASSGATLTPSATPILYAREVMFSKSSTGSVQLGSIFYVCADVIGENSSLFSVMSGTTVATATISPGTLAVTIASGSNGLSLPQATINTSTFPSAFPTGGGTIYVTTSAGVQAVTYTGTSGSNSFTGCSGGSGLMTTGGSVSSFPLAALCLCGAGGSTTGASFFQGSGTNVFGKAQICAVNTIPVSGTTADGSFWGAVAGTATTNTWFVLGFFRIDDSEPGDVDPFVWYLPDNIGNASFSRTNAASTFSLPVSATSMGVQGSGGCNAWKGYVNRVMSTSPTCSYFNCGYTAAGYGSPTPAAVINQSSTMQVQNYPGSTLPITRELFMLITDLTFHKMNKGRPRWMSIFPVGAGTDTQDGKVWFTVLGQSGLTNPAFAVGPWDGTTTPLNS